MRLRGEKNTIGASSTLRVGRVRRGALREGIVHSWMWSWWLWQWFGLVLIGAGLVVSGIVLLHRLQHGQVPTSPLVTGDTQVKAEINFASIRLGGDLAGLLVVIGVIVTSLPMLWGYYLAVAVGAAFIAIALFLWHRRHPW